MSERRRFDFLIAVIATFVILGLLFWLFMLFFQNAMRGIS